MAREIKTVITYPLTNPTGEYSIPFTYLTRAFVVITLKGLGSSLVLSHGADYEFISTTLIQLSSPTWEGYSQIEISRHTATETPLVQFTDGSPLPAKDLNQSSIQAIHIAEESGDALASTISENDSGDLDARNKKIVNVANGINSSDAVNFEQLMEAQGSLGAAISAAQAAATSASESAGTAQSSAQSATQSATNAHASDNSAHSAASHAEEMAEQASDAANRATLNAQSATQSALEAAEAADDAREDSSLASQKANEASTSAFDAKVSEDASKSYEEATLSARDEVIELLGDIQDRLPIEVQDSASISLSGSGSVTSPLIATSKIDSISSNLLTVSANGLYVDGTVINGINNRVTLVESSVTNLQDRATTLETEVSQAVTVTIPALREEVTDLVSNKWDKSAGPLNRFAGFIQLWTGGARDLTITFSATSNADIYNQIRKFFNQGPDGRTDYVLQLVFLMNTDDAFPTLSTNTFIPSIYADSLWSNYLQGYEGILWKMYPASTDSIVLSFTPYGVTSTTEINYVLLGVPEAGGTFVRI